jgi:hypothetical protein
MTATSSFRAPRSEFRVCPGRWFLTQIKEIVDFGEELAGAKS